MSGFEIFGLFCAIVIGAYLSFIIPFFFMAIIDKGGLESFGAGITAGIFGGVCYIAFLVYYFGINYTVVSL